MKVLFFLRRIGPYHHDRFREANKRLELTAIETRPLSEEYPWKVEAGGDYQTDRFPPSEVIEKGIRGKLLSKEVNRMFEAFRPDAVVTTGWADPEYHAVVLEALRRNVPRVVISDSMYETEPRKMHREWVKQLVLKAYSSALVAGTASRAYLLKLNFNAEAIFTAWDVVNNAHFAAASSYFETSHDARYFLCVARFIPEKNLFRLIAAYHRYVQGGGNRKMILAGSGPLEGAIRDQISSLRLEDQVRLEGFVSYEEMPRYMGLALCLILPSVSDTWGLVVNEAMASGLPVLVSQACGCTSDLVRIKENGCIFDPFNIDDIVDKMLFISNMDEVAWKEMGKASTEIIEHWDLSAFSEGLHRACHYALEHPTKSAVKLVHILLSA